MKYLIISLLLFIYSLSFAQVQWQNNGIPVRHGENIKWNGTTVTCDDGNMVCIWSDTRNGDSGIFAQKMSPDGVLFWGDEGIQVNDAENVQDSPVATSVDNNFVIVAWKNFQDWDNMEIRSQKIDANGDLLWDSEGILLGFYNEIEAKVYIVNDGADGALIFWGDDSFTPSSLYGIHILGDGSIAPGWEINGNQIITSLSSSNYLKVIADGYGGAVLSWRNADDLYMQRVDGSGNLLWGTNGTILCDHAQNYVTISTDNNGIYYFFWIDLRNYPQRSIYMQKVDQNGNILWVEDELIHQNSSLSRIKSVMGNDDYPIICWRSGEHLYAQKIDCDGNILWDPTGLPICINNDCGNFNSITDNYDGCWITWIMGIAPYPDIYIQHVNSNGTILLEENGMQICSAENYQGQPSINNSINDEIYISWEDWRTNSASIYSQVLNYDGIIQLPENGVEIFSGLSGETHNLKILSNGDNPFLIWKDRRYGNDSQIYIQSLNSDGSTVFEEDGIPITSFSGYGQNNFDAVLNQNSNTIAIVWEENRTGFQQVFAQAVDLSGNLLWSDTGLLVGGSTAEQKFPNISFIENSGTYEYYIGWEDFNIYTDSRIQGQKIIDGVLQWGNEGITIVDRTGNDHLQDIVENFYIWRGGSWINLDIFTKLVDENGNTAPGWEDNGNLICGAPGNQTNPRGIIVPEGLLIIWEDNRDGSLETDIYGQVITPDGTILWQENGFALVAQENDQGYFKFVYDDGLYVVWQDFRSGYNYEIYAQKFDENGNKLLQEGGILIAGGDDINPSSPDIVKVGDKIVVVWNEFTNFNTYNDIKAQLLNENGELLWNPQGLVICDEFGDQSNPQVVSNGGNDTFIAWLDNRAIYLSTGFEEIQGVYAQKVHIDTTSVENELISTGTKLYTNYPNPFKLSGTGRSPATTISFSLAKDAKNAKIEIYNIKGQKVKTLGCGESLATKADGVGYSITWDGTDKYNKPVGSGVYFYSLKIDNKIFDTNKCLLLK